MIRIETGGLASGVWGSEESKISPIINTPALSWVRVDKNDVGENDFVEDDVGDNDLLENDVDETKNDFVYKSIQKDDEDDTDVVNGFKIWLWSQI